MLRISSTRTFQGSITSLHFGQWSYNSVFLDKIIPQCPQKFVTTSCVLVLILAIIFQNCFHQCFCFRIVKHSFITWIAETQFIKTNTVCSSRTPRTNFVQICHYSIISFLFIKPYGGFCIKKNYVFIHHHFHNGNNGHWSVLCSGFCMKKNFFLCPRFVSSHDFKLVEIKVCGC